MEIKNCDASRHVKYRFVLERGSLRLSVNNTRQPLIKAATTYRLVDQPKIKQQLL